jgi:hypothetical protein
MTQINKLKNESSAVIDSIELKRIVRDIVLCTAVSTYFEYLG